MGIKKDPIKNSLAGKAFDLAAALKYQDDSVVSREIIKKGAGTVTLFAFDKGQGLSEHTAPFDATVYIAEGSAVVTVSGKPRVVKKGEMIVLPANEPHALSAARKFKMLLIMIRA
jgi:quercetin dioxygenase-like cupin family protein